MLVYPHASATFAVASGLPLFFSLIARGIFNASSKLRCGYGRWTYFRSELPLSSAALALAVALRFRLFLVLRLPPAPASRFVASLLLSGFVLASALASA